MNTKLTFVFLSLLLSLFSSCSMIQKKQSIKRPDPIREFDLDPATTQKFEERVEITTDTLVNNESADEELKVEPITVLPKSNSQDSTSKEVTTDVQQVDPKKDLKNIIFDSWDQKASKSWQKIRDVPFSAQEESKYSISLYGISVGQMTMRVEDPVYIGQEFSFHFHSHLESNKYFNYIYELSDRFESFVSQKSFLPLKTHVVRSEKIHDVSELTLYDHEMNEMSYWMKRFVDEKVVKKHKVLSIPEYYNDYISSFFFLRVVSLKPGDRFFYPIINKSKIWLLEGKAASEEELEVSAGEYQVVRLEGSLTLLDKNLKKTKSSEEMIFWIAKRAPHQMVQFQLKSSAGRITGELEKYTRD